MNGEKQQQQPESDNNNNHIQSTPSANDQPYRRETYQTLLESSRLLGQQQQKLLKPVPIDLRKHNGTNNSSKFTLISRFKFYSFVQVLFHQILVIHLHPYQHLHQVPHPA